MKNILCTALTVLCLVTTQSGSAHEFWIEPEAHRVEPGGNIRAALRVGQDFKGSEFPYLERRFKSFTVTDTDGTRAVEGALGDRPAAVVPTQAEGLHILAYHSTVDTLTFRKMEKFINYLAYEGNQWALEAHRAAGMPETGFKEEYARNAKALVQVGAVQPGDGDRAIGLPIELVAQVHPAGVSAGDVMPVQLLWQGEPLAGQQINIFTKGMEGDPTHVVTDDAGLAEIPLKAAGRYLLNAVHIFERDGAGDVYWESYWASLTFAVD